MNSPHKALYKVETREEAIERYVEWIKAPSQTWIVDKIRRELKGKDLVCFCKPKACHADILLEIANGTE